MNSTEPEPLDSRAQAIEAALHRIGEPISEAQARRVYAALEDCEC